MAVAIPGFAMMLLVLVCGNVALLLFARAATRESEFIVRSALGASRGRIVAQLFAEALVLGGIAAAVGLAAADFGLRQLGRAVPRGEHRDGSRSGTTRTSRRHGAVRVLLTLLAAAIAGVDARAQGDARHGRAAPAGGGRRGGLKFGGVWTAVIIAQVAFTMAFPGDRVLWSSSMLRARADVRRGLRGRAVPRGAGRTG